MRFTVIYRTPRLRRDTIVEFNENCFSDLRREREREGEMDDWATFLRPGTLYSISLFSGNIFRNNSSVLKGLADWRE